MCFRFCYLIPPSIFLFNPSCELSNIRTNELLHFIAVSCVLQEKTNLRKISKGRISKVKVKKIVTAYSKNILVSSCALIAAPPALVAHRSYWMFRGKRQKCRSTHLCQGCTQKISITTICSHRLLSETAVGNRNDQCAKISFLSYL